MHGASKIQRERKLGSTLMNLSEHCHLEIQRETVYFPLNVKFVCSGWISFLFLDMCWKKGTNLFSMLRGSKRDKLSGYHPTRRRYNCTIISGHIAQAIVHFSSDVINIYSQPCQPGTQRKENSWGISAHYPTHTPGFQATIEMPLGIPDKSGL